MNPVNLLTAWSFVWSDSRVERHRPSEDFTMKQVKSIAEWMADQGIGLDQLLHLSGLERKVVDAIVHGRYTPSPQQRQRLAAALAVAPEQVTWGHQNAVDHMYGHGPQFGRSP